MTSPTLIGPSRRRVSASRARRGLGRLGAWPPPSSRARTRPRSSRPARSARAAAVVGAAAPPPLLRVLVLVVAARRGEHRHEREQGDEQQERSLGLDGLLLCLHPWAAAPAFRDPGKRGGYAPQPDAGNGHPQRPRRGPGRRPRARARGGSSGCGSRRSCPPGTRRPWPRYSTATNTMPSVSSGPAGEPPHAERAARPLRRRRRPPAARRRRPCPGRARRRRRAHGLDEEEQRQEVRRIAVGRRRCESEEQPSATMPHEEGQRVVPGLRVVPEPPEHARDCPRSGRRLAATPATVEVPLRVAGAGAEQPRQVGLGDQHLPRLGALVARDRRRGAPACRSAGRRACSRRAGGAGSATRSRSRG